MEGDHADSAMVVLLVALEMMFIEQLGPGAEPDGMTGELVERLADELGTGAADGDMAGVAATDEDGSDAAEALEIGCVMPLLTIRSEDGDEARHQGDSCARQRTENGRVGVIGGD